MIQKSNKQKVVNGISSQTLVTIVLGIVEIVSFSIMSRLLSKTDFGYYAAISSIVLIFSSFSETGIGAAIIQRKRLTKRFVDNAFTLSLLFGLAISFLLFILSGTLADTVADHSMTMPLMIMSVTLLLNCLTSVFKSIMHRRLEFLRIGAINLTALVFTTIIAILLAFYGFGYYAIIAKSVLQSVVTFVLTWYFCKTSFSLSIDKYNASKIFRFSGWLMASVVFRNIAHQVDKLLMPRLLTIEALGAYNRPKDFMNQISSKLNGIFDSALFPVLSSIQDEKKKLSNAFIQSLSILNIFAMLLTLTFALNSQLIIRIFFGEEWMSLNEVTIILSFALVFNIDGRLSDCYLRSMGMTQFQFYFRIFEAAVNIIGVLVGYNWGIIGVAYSVVATNALTKILKTIYVANKIDIGALDIIMVIIKSWKYMLILIPICVVGLYFFSNNIWGNVAQGILFSITVLLIFLCFPKIVGETYNHIVYNKLISIAFKKLKFI